MGGAMSENERAVEVTDGDGTKVKIGIEVAAGPETYRLMLTRPLDKEGRIEEIPCEDIESIHEVEPGPRGQPPEIVED